MKIQKGDTFKTYRRKRLSRNITQIVEKTYKVLEIAANNVDVICKEIVNGKAQEHELGFSTLYVQTMKMRESQN